MMDEALRVLYYEFLMYGQTKDFWVEVEKKRDGSKLIVTSRNMGEPREQKHFLIHPIGFKRKNKHWDLEDEMAWNGYIPGE